MRRPGRPYGRSVLDHGPVAPAVVVGIAAVARRKYEPLRRPMSKVPAANLADVGEGAVRRPERFVVLVYDERRPAVGFVCGIVGKTLQPRRVRGKLRKAPERRTTQRFKWRNQKNRDPYLWRGINGPVAPAVVVGIAAIARRKYEPLRRPMSKVPAAYLADVRRRCCAPARAVRGPHI